MKDVWNEIRAFYKSDKSSQMLMIVVGAMTLLMLLGFVGLILLS